MSEITFSFGQNWKNYVGTIDESNVEKAKLDLIEWLGSENIQGKEIIDIGSGSGIHSLSFYLLGAAKLISFDYDPKSVESTSSLWVQAERPSHWTVEKGSILDKGYLKKFGQFDIVYSWGVLHHTGSMWEAIENAASFVKRGGQFFISIYAKGPNYPGHLDLKKRYNNSSAFGKKIMVWNYILRKIILKRIRKRQNPFGWNVKKERGMTVYYDVVDWLGGLPYEVATEEELTSFLKAKGFLLRKKVLKPEGACHRLLYSKDL